MRFFLTGFMGCGKSFWAKKLSIATGIPSFDLDEWIESKEQCSIASLFEEKGESYFRQIEQEYLHSLTIHKPNMILACGGGTPCFADNMEWMKTMGTVFYLQVPFSILEERLLLKKETRPLLKTIAPDNFTQKLKILFATREAIYKQATEIIDMECIDEITFANKINSYV